MANKRDHGYSVLIEGNIASGKSTIIELLKNKLGNVAQIHVEPLHEWTNFCGENLLKKLYENPKENAFIFQTFVQYTMTKIQFEEAPNQVKISERSLLSERFVFIEAIRILKYVTPLQYEILVAWFNLLNSKVPAVDEVIYLRTSPLVALGRLRGRNRAEEETVSKEYLALLHSLHESWLIDWERGDLPFKLTIIDQDRPLKELEPEIEKIAERLRQNVRN
jgi:deoxyadenosine/deoxycytidine kinase